MIRHRGIRCARQIAAVLPIAFSSGCFQYTQVPLAQAAVGREIRVHLTDSGYARLHETAGDQLPQLRKTVEGPLIAANDQRILVAVPVWTGGPTTHEILQQRVAIPIADVLGLERKSLDKRRTTLIVAGAGAALVAFIAYHVSGEFGGTTGTFPEPGQTESIQVLFRLSR